MLPADQPGGSVLRNPQIGIVGTFDVENYGDLLFPLLAEHELRARLGPIELHRFSYHAKSAPRWPYDVHSVAALPERIADLDALLIGGGFLIRFDADVAPGYAPPTPDVHHPTGYWLTPALIAAQHDVPVVWNAPGMHDNSVPAWAAGLVAEALAASAYVAVRDEPTRTALRRVSDAPITVVPDTAFALGTTLAAAAPPAAEAPVAGPYVVVQAALSTGPFAEAVRANPDAFAGTRFVALPVGPVLGDHNDLLAGLPDVVALPDWPHPLDLARIVQGAQAVVGHSYHLAITAWTAGVPVFMPTDRWLAGKYTAFTGLGGIAPLDLADLPGFLAALGRRDVPAELDALAGRVADHWDRVAEVVRSGPTGTGRRLDRAWQRLPGVLQTHEARIAALTTAHESERNTLAARIGALEAQVAAQADDLARSVAHRERQRAAIEALEQNAIEQAARLARTETVAERRAATIAALESAAIRHEAQRRALEHTVGERDTDIARLEGVAATATSRAETLQALVAIARTALGEPPPEDAGVGVAPIPELLRRVGRGRHAAPASTTAPILATTRLLHTQLATDPFEWARVDGLFAAADAARLAATFPNDGFEVIAGYGGEKDYEYRARALVAMGATAGSGTDRLDPVWQRLTTDLLSARYRAAVSLLSGCDLTDATLEVNVFHYQPGHALGPHVDLPDKIVTHVMYFNRAWDDADGGCLSILRSGHPADECARVPPIVGSSVVLVRSDRSWHAVAPVAAGTASRRSLTATFYRPGSVSSMWPAPPAAAPLPLPTDRPA